jgi:sugar/nucleoside kinase (ribokinase family)
VIWEKGWRLLNGLDYLFPNEEEALMTTLRMR